MVGYPQTAEDFERTLESAFSAMGMGMGMVEKSFAAYVDVSVEGGGSMRKLGGEVPCRSIWDGEGERLAAVLVFDGF